MSTEQNKTIACRYFEDVWNKGNAAVIDEIIALNVLGHVAGKDFRSLDVLRQRVAALRTIYSDPHFTVEDQIAEGDRVGVRWTLRGTHSGEYMGHPPTGKHMTVTGINIFRIAGGKIAELWVESDDLGELQQLGVVPDLSG